MKYTKTEKVKAVYELFSAEVELSFNVRHAKTHYGVDDPNYKAAVEAECLKLWSKLEGEADVFDELKHRCNVIRETTAYEFMAGNKKAVKNMKRQLVVHDDEQPGPSGLNNNDDDEDDNGGRGNKTAKNKKFITIN